MLTTNQVLHKGRYRIINLFSQDETGGIYEAYDTVSNTKVVLRESIGKLDTVPTSTRLQAINSAFAGGARDVNEMRHESLVSVCDYFSEINNQYLVLEAVTGSDLGKYLQPGEQRPTLQQSLSWADQLLAALSYLHRFSPPIIHGEIRPENIKLTSGNKVKLLTEPIAKAAVQQADSAFSVVEDSAFCYRPLEQLWDTLDQTSQRIILKSYDERAEEILTRPLDARSDLYSLAASLYHILAGSPPIDALERSIAILDGKPDPLQSPSDLDGNVPHEVSDVIVRSMSIRREDRYDSAVILMQVLRTAIVRVEERMEAQAWNDKDDLIDLTDGRSQNMAPSPIDPPAVEAPAMPEPEMRSTVSEREQEIVAEQARLEKEEQIIEQRRGQLAAEKQRILMEAESARLQVEQEARQLEKEKMMRAAEAERELAANTLQELRVGTQIQTADFKSEATIESDRSGGRHEHHAVIEPDGADDDDLMLLEIQHISNPPGKPIEPPKDDSVDTTIAAQMATGSVREVSPAVEHSMFGAYDSSGTDDGSQKTTGRKAFVAAGAVILLSIIGIGYWKLAPLAETTNSVSTQQPAVQTQMIAQPPAPDVQPTPAEQTSPSDASAAVNTVATEPEPVNERARQSQLSTAADRSKKPAVAKAAPTKKKVTVDDLINDN